MDQRIPDVPRRSLNKALTTVPRRFRDRLPEHHGDAAALEAVIETPNGCGNG